MLRTFCLFLSPNISSYNYALGWQCAILILCDLMMLGHILFTLYMSAQQVKVHGIAQHFGTLWNAIDAVNIVLLTIVLILTVTYRIFFFSNEKNKKNFDFESNFDFSIILSCC